MQALSVASEQLNDAARAHVIASAAAAFFYGGDVVQAGAYFADADALSPYDPNVVYP